MLFHVILLPEKRAVMILLINASSCIVNSRSEIGIFPKTWQMSVAIASLYLVIITECAGPSKKAYRESLASI